MKTIALNRSACEANNITVGEALLLLALQNNVNLVDAEDSLVKRGFITAKRDSTFKPNGWKLTKTGIDILNNVVIDSIKLNIPNEDERLNNLAEKLKEIFPKGKKEGTKKYWAEGKALIVRRLKLFFSKYGNNFEDEAIINAAKSYVNSYNGDYTLMRTLHYFILKEDRINDRITSDLLTEIEHLEEEQEEVTSSNWVDNVR